MVRNLGASKLRQYWDIFLRYLNDKRLCWNFAVGIDLGRLINSDTPYVIRGLLVDFFFVSFVI